MIKQACLLRRKSIEVSWWMTCSGKKNEKESVEDTANPVMDLQKLISR
jgi:hypothetical protein